MKIQAVRWFAPYDMRLVEEEAPVPQADEVLLRVTSVGVCGSDMHYFREGGIGGNVLKAPTILGHEYAGVVEAAGSAAGEFLLGKRVAVEPGIPCGGCEHCRTGRYNICEHMAFPGGPGCDGALREYMTAPIVCCFPVPEEMSAPVAAMIEPAAVAVHTIELAHIRPGDTVFIQGLGPIGLLTAQLAQRAGAVKVYGADLLHYRVAAAARYGVDAAYGALPGGPDAGGAGTAAWLKDQTGGRGVDVAFDCSNRPEGLAIVVQATRPGGRCVLTGISGSDVDPMPVSLARRRELCLQWCRRFVHNYPATLALVSAGKLDVASLVTHSFPLERSLEAFQLVADNAEEVLKASIDR